MAKKIIYTTAEGGVAVVHPTGEVADLNVLARQVVPAGLAYQIVEESAIPTDRTFRAAWVQDAPGHVGEDLAKAKEVGHEIRRAKRNEEFAPHDEVIAKQIPGASAEEAEAAREEIRTRYEAIQTAIEGAADTATIKTELGL